MTYQDFTPGTKVKVTGVPARVKDFTGKEIDNPLLGMEGVVTNSQPEDVNVQIDGYGNTGFLPETLTVIETEEQHKEREADAREAKARTEYPQSHFVKLELPQVDGVELRLETEDEYAKRRRVTSYVFTKPNFTKPNLWFVVGEHKELVEYLNVGDRWDEKMRYQISHKVTGYKKRNYSKLETAAKKFKECADAFDAEQARKAKRRQANHDYAEALRAHFAKTFPAAKKHDYRDHYVMPVVGVYGGVKMHANRTEGEFNGTYSFGEVGSKLTADQVTRIVAILEENA